MALGLLAIACGDDGSGAPASSSGMGGSSEGSTAASEDSATVTGDPAADSTAAADTTGEGSTGAEEPSGAWEARAPLLAGPRQETGVTALDGEVYVLGGFTETGTLVPRVEAYDPSTDSWRAVADLPQALHHANAAAVGGELVVAGFLEGLTFSARGDVLAYDPVADAWSSRTPMPVGTERGASGVAVYEGNIVLCGGFRDGALADVWAYDVAADLWDVAADMPYPLDHLAAATIGDRIYVVGGRDAAIAAHTDRLLIYDPARDSWSEGEPMPTSRAGIMAGVLEGQLFVAGGEGNAGMRSGVFDQFEAYDAAGSAWFVLPSMLTPRHGTGAAVVDGLLFVPGGATVEALGAVDTHEAWRPG